MTRRWEDEEGRCLCSRTQQAAATPSMGVEVEMVQGGDSVVT